MASACVNVRLCAPKPVIAKVARRSTTVSRMACAAVDGKYNPLAVDLDYVDAVLDAFPDAAVANPDEARALYSKGDYIWLDVRHPVDVDKWGKVKNSIQVPYMLAKKRFVDGEVQVETSPNPDFMAQLQKRFPNQDTKLLVGDMNGESAIDALTDLDEAGYVNIVGLQGGYMAWMRTWDNKLLRRNLGEYQEDPYGEGETSCQIHASGAGFKNGDAQSADFWASL